MGYSGSSWNISLALKLFSSKVALKSQANTEPAWVTRQGLISQLSIPVEMNMSHWLTSWMDICELSLPSRPSLVSASDVW